MHLLGYLFLAAAAWALWSGKAQWGPKIVTRDAQPLAYWTNVAVLLALAGLLFSIVPVR